MPVVPITVAARRASPYVHLDNRAFVVSDGAHCVALAESTLGWVRETIELLLEEKRATRHRGDAYLGGWVDDEAGTVTLYAGPPHAMATVELTLDALASLRDKLRGN